MQKRNLGDIVEIRFGLYTQPQPGGTASYLQVRHFSEDGRLITRPEEFVHKCSNNAPHILQDGDILFVGKGNRLFAWCYRGMPDIAIASSIFFVLRPIGQLIHSEYLAAILNAPQSKKAFLQIGSGTNIFSIRKSELSAFEIPVPTLSRQREIAELTELHQHEVALAQRIIEEKQNLYTSIISTLLK